MCERKLGADTPINDQVQGERRFLSRREVDGRRFEEAKQRYPSRLLCVCVYYLAIQLTLCEDEPA
jgi:hypothetical protein